MSFNYSLPPDEHHKLYKMHLLILNKVRKMAGIAEPDVQDREGMDSMKRFAEYMKLTVPLRRPGSPLRVAYEKYCKEKELYSPILDMLYEWEAEKDQKARLEKLAGITPPDYSKMNFDFTDLGLVKPAGTELTIMATTTMDA